MILTDQFKPIRQWASDRGIYTHGDAKTQMLKLNEEVGELSKAILDNNHKEVKDAIGDCVIVLTNLSELCDLTIEECVNEAFAVIKNRTGKMSNGTFVKDGF